MMNFVCILCGSTPGQIQYGGFKRALAKKSGDMIRDRVRILYLLFLWLWVTLKFFTITHNLYCKSSNRKIQAEKVRF